VRFTGSTLRPAELDVYRTDLPRPRVVSRTRIPAEAHTAAWDGRANGRPAPTGIYRLQIRARDLAGNVALSAPRAPGIGVTARGVAIQPPLGSHPAGSRLTFLLDTRGRPYRWSVRRAGARRVAKRGRGHGPVLRLRAPGGASCACILTVRAGRDQRRVPFAVTSRRHHRVLVVLPALSWAGSNPADDDGNGVPNTLDRGEVAPLRRPFPALPAGFAAVEARVTAHLDRSGLVYDLTTDAALALGSGPKLAGHSGVLLAGTEEWLPARTSRALRAWVEGGGRLASFSVHSLRRSVQLAGTADPSLVSPSPLEPTDALGSRFGPIVRRRVTLTVFRQGAGLFDTVSGVFPRWAAYEETRGVGSGTFLAEAGPDPDTPVIVGYSLGRGQVFRAGLPGWAARLGTDPTVSALTDRAWQLLSR
jgi:hypothetical protein